MRGKIAVPTCFSHAGTNPEPLEVVVQKPAPASAVTFRRFVAEDAAAAHQLSLSVRWPHRLQDWKFIQGLGAGFVAEDASGLIGTAMCWSHGADHASLGMVIVSGERQGQGIGRKLMDMVLGEIGERAVLLHATPAGLPLYENMGFVRTGEVHQHQGTVFESRLIALQPGERIRPVGARDLSRLADLGTRATGMPRRTVLTALQDVAEGVVIDRYDEIIGFAMLRRFGHGYAIGPVVAPDIERAKALISHWAGSYAGSFMRIDVTGKSGLSAWLNELGLVQIDTVVSMVRGEAPLEDKNIHQFAVTSQALG